MVGQALQFQGNASQRLGADGDLAAGKGLHCLAVGHRMAHRRVSGHRLHHVDGALGRSADERPLDAPVLVTERDLEVEDLFSVALEPEMSRLDDAGVDGADGHLMDLLPLDAIVFHDAYDWSLAWLSVPGIVVRPVGSVKANRLEPGVALRTDPVLLGDFPLEEMDLRAIRRHGRKTV